MLSSLFVTDCCSSVYYTEKEETDMDKKQFIVTTTLPAAGKFEKWDDAVNYGKRLVGPNSGYTQAYVSEVQAVVKQPVPEAEVTKLT